MLLGQNTLGKFGLGDFGSNPKVTLAGVFGTGVAGSIFPSTGANKKSGYGTSTIRDVIPYARRFGSRRSAYSRYQARCNSC